MTNQKEKRRYFVIADIHGFYKEMLAALNAAGFDKDNPEHFLISLGDACDRGPASHKVVKYLLNLPKNRRVLIKGNHWDLLEAAIKNNRLEAYDYSNGTVKTMAQFTGMSEFDPPTALIRECFYSPLYRKYRDELVDYYETEHYVFVHGWIPCEIRMDIGERGVTGVKLVKKYKLNDDWRRGNWDEARWTNGMEAWNNGVMLPDKEIVCGHWHTSYAWANIAHVGTEFGEDARFDPFIDRGIVALDACTARTHKINCFVCEEEVDETMEM